MPIYEYRCTDCGQQKDHLQKVSDAPLDTCPACGSRSYSKALTAAGFQLKGNGWYATDFKGSSSAKAASADSPTNAGSPAAAETTTAAPASGGSCNPGCACH